MYKEFVGHDAPDGQGVKGGGDQGEDGGELEDHAVRRVEVLGQEPDLEAQEQEAGDHCHADLDASVLEEDQRGEVREGDCDEEAQEIHVVREIDVLSCTSGADCHCQGDEEKGRYDAAGQGKI